MADGEKYKKCKWNEPEMKSEKWDGEKCKKNGKCSEPEMVDGEGIGGHHDHHRNIEREEAEKWISTFSV